MPRWLRQVLLRGLAVGAAPIAIPSMDGAARGAARRSARGAATLAARRARSSSRRRRWRARRWRARCAYKAHRAVVEQARLAQQFGQEVERIAAISRYAASLPLHDTRREMDAIRARMERLEERMRALGPLAAGPGHEALGRGYLALERYDDALRELEAAWATGYRSPELAYALGLVHGKLYQRALGEMPKTNDAKLDAARRAEIARAHRDPALRYLKEARRATRAASTRPSTSRG